MCMCEREGKRAALTLVRAHCPCCCTHPPGTYMREGLCCLPPFPPRRAGKQEEYGAGSPLRGPAALPPSLPSEGRGRLGEVDEEGAEEDQEHKQEDADGAQLDPHGDLGTRSPDVLRVLVQLQPDLVDPLLKALDEGVLALKLLADRGAQVVELVKPERDQVKLLVLLLPSAFPILPELFRFARRLRPIGPRCHHVDSMAGIQLLCLSQPLVENLSPLPNLVRDLPDLLDELVQGPHAADYRLLCEPLPPRDHQPELHAGLHGLLLLLPELGVLDSNLCRPPVAAVAVFYKEVRPLLQVRNHLSDGGMQLVKVLVRGDGGRPLSLSRCLVLLIPADDEVTSLLHLPEAIHFAGDAGGPYLWDKLKSH
mmetsp:Transcript_14750/g.35126  ORF Transcript_14750/g.35126 Transcript_14750/m.35126 type:complete len:367 (-) Transcript_14750:395-1495(-)